MLNAKDLRPGAPTQINLGRKNRMVADVRRTITPDPPTEVLAPLTGVQLRAVVGRRVHYVEHAPEDQECPCRAAVVTEPSTRSDGATALMIMSPVGLTFCVVPYAEPSPLTGYRPGTWHWPEEV